MTAGVALAAPEEEGRGRGESCGGKGDIFAGFDDGGVDVEGGVFGLGE